MLEDVKRRTIVNPRTARRAAYARRGQKRFGLLPLQQLILEPYQLLFLKLWPFCISATGLSWTPKISFLGISYT